MTNTEKFREVLEAYLAFMDAKEKNPGRFHLGMHRFAERELENALWEISRKIAREVA